MDKYYGTLSEVFSKRIQDNELVYIGTKSGSGFFFIGYKSDFNEDYAPCLDRLVDTIYERTINPEENGTVIILKSSPIKGGTYWFHDEFLEAGNMLKPFSPKSEILHGRYQLADGWGIGKFNRIYHETRVDYFGNKFPLATFSAVDARNIRQRSFPAGCFIPTEAQLDAWLSYKIGERWRKRPDEVLKEFRLNYYGDALEGKIAKPGRTVCLATGYEERIGDQRIMRIGTEGVTFERWSDCQYVSIPVFFTRNYRDYVLSNRSF